MDTIIKSIDDFLDTINNKPRYNRQNQKRLDVYKLKKLDSEIESLGINDQEITSDQSTNQTTDQSINIFKSINKPPEVVTYNFPSIDDLKLKKININKQIKINEIDLLIDKINSNIKVKTYDLDFIDQLIFDLSSYNLKNDNEQIKQLNEYSDKLSKNKFYNFSIKDEYINTKDFYNNNCIYRLRYLKFNQTNHLIFDNIINNSISILSDILNDDLRINNEIIMYLKKFNISEHELKIKLDELKNKYTDLLCNLGKIVYLYNKINSNEKRNINDIFKHDCKKYIDTNFTSEIENLALKDKN